MPLLVSILILLMLGLAIFQGWQLWYTRRELARLEQRLAESLDDQDLLEFQERLKGLLTETKDAGLGLVQTIERRQGTLEKVIERSVEAEKRLSVRAQLLELAAKELAKAPVKVDAPAKPRPVARRPTAKAAAPVDLPVEPAQAQPPIVKQVPAEAAPPATARAASGPNRYSRVYELSDQGLSREQIARESGILPGEIELILNLRGGKRAPR